MYLHDDNLLVNEAIRLYENRDNPFALEYDWLGARLFWVEEGERVSKSKVYSPKMEAYC